MGGLPARLPFCVRSSPGDVALKGVHDEAA